jgi:pSer/pThr/pTyr-binding forkhead associated (FHA) protein
LSVLRNIEHKIESLFEGVFGRAFRANVQPVELARKLIKEMDDHKSVSVSKVYVPNEYEVYLSEADRAQFAEYEDSLVDELRDYLVEHARREGYVLLSQPRVSFETDSDLALGEFGIATRMTQKPAGAAAAPEPGATMIYKPVQQPTEAASAEELGVGREVVALEVAGQSHPVEKRRVVLGRSRECDIQVNDPNISRRHAEIRQDGATYWLVDLDSTNGIEVNGRRQKRVKLENGTRATLGSTEVVFHRELA